MPAADFAEQIKVNAETYYTQAAKVLDPARTGRCATKQRMVRPAARGMIQLVGQVHGGRMMERNDFHTRFTDLAAPSACTSFKPAAAGYDSVALKSDLGAGRHPTVVQSGWDGQASAG